MKFHSRLIKFGLVTDTVIATQLIHAYLTSYPLDSYLNFLSAVQLFDQVPHKDIGLWSTMISVHTRNGFHHESIELLSRMYGEGEYTPNHYIYASIAKSIGSVAEPHLAEIIHSCVIKSSFLSNVIVCTSFVDMYGKCGLINSAQKMFDEMYIKNIVTWNAMMTGFMLNGMSMHALRIFYRMINTYLEKPDEFTLASTLAACTCISKLKLGTQIHSYIVRTGYEADTVLANAILNFYFRCGEVDCARRVLQGRAHSDILKITTIKGYAFNRRHHDCIKCIDNDFSKVIIVDPSIVIYILSAFTNLSLLNLGKQLHCLTITSNIRQMCHPADIEVLECVLIDMYSKCGSMKEAIQVFSHLSTEKVSHWNSIITGFLHNGMFDDASNYFYQMPERNTISWTTMIAAYTRFGFPNEGLKLLIKIYKECDLKGNCYIFSAALDACSRLLAIDSGKQIHAKSIRTEFNVVVETSLVDMYSKSGDLRYARRIFDNMQEKNVMSWTSMITGYAIHGHGSEALDVFQKMLVTGLKPNEVTFVSVLNACCHCGMINEGLHYFDLMRRRYNIVPTTDHYTCLVDMLGRAGKLSEAWNLIVEFDRGQRKDGLEDNGAMLGALLAGCRLHGEVKMGGMVAKKMLERKKQVTETYIMLSNVYAVAGMWDHVYTIREECRDHSQSKEPGYSQIQLARPH